MLHREKMKRNCHLLCSIYRGFLNYVDLSFLSVSIASLRNGFSYQFADDSIPKNDENGMNLTCVGFRNSFLSLKTAILEKLYRIL